MASLAPRWHVDHTRVERERRMQLLSSGFSKPDAEALPLDIQYTKCVGESSPHTALACKPLSLSLVARQTGWSSDASCPQTGKRASGLRTASWRLRWQSLGPT